MPEVLDGQTVEVKGSGSSKHTLRNVGGVYSCSCPAWRNQSIPIERRSCKHLRAYRGEAAEEARTGSAATTPVRSARARSDGQDGGAPVLLAERYTGQDIAGWWVSEKLDGVRAYWDGTQFLSRQGNVFLAPDFFCEKLPAYPLDGELWCGRKQFQRLVSIVRRQDKGEPWREVRYVLFDAPDPSLPFEERLARCQQLCKEQAPPFVQVLAHERCTGADDLQRRLAAVEAQGGEGLMLRRPASLYEVGRSDSLLKVKSFLDAEAKVLAHIPGKGRHQGRMGAVLVEMPNGTRFEVGTGFSDAERESPPPIGAVITYRYVELSDGGVPRFPAYVGLRAEALLAASAAPRTAPAPAPATAPAPASSAPAKPAPAPSPSAAPGLTRRLTMVEGGSSKFWELCLSGASHTVRYGKLGTKGQSKTKDFASAEAAQADADALLAEKVKKGYRED